LTPVLRGSYLGQYTAGLGPHHLPQFHGPEFLEVTPFSLRLGGQNGFLSLSHSGIFAHARSILARLLGRMSLHYALSAMFYGAFVTLVVGNIAAFVQIVIVFSSSPLLYSRSMFIILPLFVALCAALCKLISIRSELPFRPDRAFPRRTKHGIMPVLLCVSSCGFPCRLLLASQRTRPALARSRSVQSQWYL